MKIQLLSKTVHQASIEVIEAKQGKAKNKKVQIQVRLDNELFENSTDKTIFRLRFIANIEIEDRAKLNIAYDFDFKGDIEISDEIANSSTIKSEAPSIAYPYIKVYAETLVNMSGIGNYVMPFFDFHADPFE